MINVLLVSPRLPPGSSNRCGDHTYTDNLLNYPPPGVVYTHYEDLIAQNKAKRTRALIASAYYLGRVGILPPDTWYEAIRTDYQPDLIHIYGFSATVWLKKNSKKLPIILGAGTGSYSDLKYYHLWDEKKIKRARLYKKLFLQMMRAHDSSLRPERASAVLTWSNFSKEMHLDEGYVKREQILTLYPGFPMKPDSIINESNISVNTNTTFLFVGNNFERKNGYMVLEAFRAIHQHHPGTQLILIGLPRNKEIICEPGVKHYHYIPHQEMLTKIYPQADVLLLPSKGEGFGFVIVEAMALGIPAIAVDAWAMPEIVRPGQNGFLIAPDSVETFTSFMEQLVTNKDLLMAMKKQSARIFQEQFSIEHHNNCLSSIYKSVLGQYNESGF